MKTTFASTVLFVMLAAALPQAQDDGVRITFNGGRVTLTAKDALVSDVLAEWARVGGTLVTGTDSLSPSKVTVDLADTDEQDAIAVVIGSAAGYAAKVQSSAPVEGSILTRLALFPRTAAEAEDAPARVIDKSLPESLYTYPAPLIDDVDAFFARPRPLRPPSTSGSGGNELIPELRFKYVDPVLHPTP